VAAVDTENGTLKWVYEINTTDSDNRSNDNCYISCLQANGNILAFRYDVPGVAHGLIALDPSTGKEVWRYKNLREYSHDPFFYKDLICVGGEEVIALSAESGEEVWKTDTDEWVISAEVKNDKLFVKEELSNNSYRSIVLDANTGEILETLPNSEISISFSATTDEFIYSTGGCKINIFDSSTGEPVWRSSRIKGAVLSEPTLYKDKLYLVSSDGTLYAFDHGEGGLFFTRGLEDSAILYLPPIATAGMLLLLATLLRKNKNKALVFGSWLIALVGVLLLSFIAIQPYFIAWDVFGILTFLVLCALGVILLFGIAFLVSGIRKRRK
jgi:outer membrane protein assembly factor BamB